MAGAARAVRIPREGNGTSIPVESAPAATSALPRPSPSQRFTNSAGSSRAYRTLVLFLVGIAAIYGVFMGLAVRSSVDGSNDVVEAILTAAMAVALVIGWFVTLGQAPTAAWVENGQLVVKERTGRFRRFPTGSVHVRVVRSNGAGPFGPEPTEFVEVSVPRGARRTYLVGTNFFDFAL